MESPPPGPTELACEILQEAVQTRAAPPPGVSASSPDLKGQLQLWAWLAGPRAPPLQHVCPERAGRLSAWRGTQDTTEGKALGHLDSATGSTRPQLCPPGHAAQPLCTSIFLHNTGDNFYFIGSLWGGNHLQPSVGSPDTEQTLHKFQLPLSIFHHPGLPCICRTGTFPNELQTGSHVSELGLDFPCQHPPLKLRAITRGSSGQRGAGCSGEGEGGLKDEPAGSSAPPGSQILKLENEQSLPVGRL